MILFNVGDRVRAKNDVPVLEGNAFHTLVDAGGVGTVVMINEQINAVVVEFDDIQPNVIFVDGSDFSVPFAITDSIEKV